MSIVPIFIVGVPRSGTTLIAAMLAAHSKLSCGPETHFFRMLAKADADELVNPLQWPRKATEFVASTMFTNYFSDQKTKLLQKYQLDESKVYNYLSSKTPAIPSVLSSVTEQYMRLIGKQRWVEKTPDHIQDVRLIRRYFPKSPIIRIIRDPRDVAISLAKLSWGANSFLDGLNLWRKLDLISDQFFSQDEYSYTVRYEDLVLAPREELYKMCKFIGEDFEEEMLDTSSSGKQVNSMNVPWKEKASQSIDSSRLYVWRRELVKDENILAEAILGDRLAKYSYERLATFNYFGDFYPRYVISPRHEDSLRLIANKGIRFWKNYPNETPKVRIYLGDPCSLNWTGNSKIKKAFNTLYVLSGIIKDILAGDQLYWIPDGYNMVWSGYSSFVLKSLLSRYII